MRRLKKKVESTLKGKKPFRFLGALGAVRDIVLGVIFIISLSQATETRIFRNFDALVPGTSGTVAGWIMLLIGLTILAGVTLERARLASAALQAQSAVWLFSAVMYVKAGEWALAVVYGGLLWSILSAYLALYYKYDHKTEGHKVIKGETASLS